MTPYYQGMARHRGDSPLSGEAAALRELGQLVVDPVYRGQGVPRGDGRPVVVLPGLFGNDIYLQPLHTWLVIIGYRPVISAIPFNAACPERTLERVERHVRGQVRDDGSPIAIIGHSRGGLLGWSLAQRLGPRVTHLAMLGSPIAPLRGDLRRRFRMPRTAVTDAGARARRVLDPDCGFPACGCRYVDDLGESLPPGTRVLSVYTSEDRIVAPSMSRVPEGTNVEVTGTHSGLVYNRAVYRELGRFLASR
jgi:pimeloyl-ACP methyl ester carboxylesterase